MSEANKNVVVGISGLYHDSAIAVVRFDGQIVFATHEERFSRVKHDARLPMQALKAAAIYCEKYGYKPVEAAFYENPVSKRERQFFNLGIMAAHGSPDVKQLLAKVKSDRTEELVIELVKTAFGGALPVSFNISHHYSHAYSAFLPSGFESALTLVADGVGEWETLSAYNCQGTTMEKVWSRRFPDSIGLFYSAMTQLCGFKVNSGEYKLMGLAPYGEPKYVDLIEREILIEKPYPKYFSLNQKYFGYLHGQSMLSDAMLSLFNLEGIPNDGEQEKVHLDIAASAQKVLERLLAKIVNSLMVQTNNSRLCMAGGVALNCVNNSKLLALEAVEEFFVQPASGDAGGALGAALAVVRENGSYKRQAMPIPYLGLEYGSKDLEKALQQRNLKCCLTFSSDEESINAVCERLQKGQVGGFFSGRSEYGPRALGARSIIAMANSVEMQARVNMKVKYRESFRPFAPVVLKECVDDVFEIDADSPYMLFVGKTKGAVGAGALLDEAVDEQSILSHLKKTRAPYPAVTHVDGTARVQTVSQENGIFYKLLRKWYQLSGMPVLINTSFNVRGEPIVETPLNAIDGFLATDMDFLYLQGLIIDKADIDTDLLKSQHNRVFAKD